MIEVLPIERIRVRENRCRLFEGDSLLLQIGEGLAGVPGKHICVYTLIQQPSQWVTANAQTGVTHASTTWEEACTEQPGFDLEWR